MNTSDSNNPNTVEGIVLRPEIDDIGSRIDSFLAKNLENISRSKIQNMISFNQILCDNLPIKASNKITDLECSFFIQSNTIKSTEEEYPVASGFLNFDIIYEDCNILIINE